MGVSFFRLFVGPLVIAVVDQLSKWFFASAHPLIVWPGLLELRRVDNPGIAFSLPLTGWPLMLLTIVILAGFAVFFSRRIRRDVRLGRFVFALILGGGVGNLIDRMRFGAVVDFVAVWKFPIFNLADAAIAVGAALLAWRYATLLVPAKNANPTRP